MVYFRYVSFVIGFLGCFILGVVFVLIFVYSLVSRIRCIGSFFFILILFIIMFFKWSYRVIMFLYSGFVKFNSIRRFILVIFVRRWKFLDRFLIIILWISIFLFVVCIIISIFRNFFRIGRFFSRSSNVVEAYEFSVSVFNSVRYRILFTFITIIG